MHGDNEIQGELECKMNANTKERRNKPRINCDYPAIVEGIDLQGKTYEENAKLANLSAGGLYLWVNRDIVCGSKISVTIFFTKKQLDKNTPQIATKGILIRNEPQANGIYGAAVKFEHFRFV